MLSTLPDTDLTMTTNGILLPSAAEKLKSAGLKRVTISLDSLDNDVFQAMNDVGASVQDVLLGVEAAERAGLHPIKINMVVMSVTYNPNLHIHLSNNLQNLECCAVQSYKN